MRLHYNKKSFSFLILVYGVDKEKDDELKMAENLLMKTFKMIGILKNLEEIY